MAQKLAPQPAKDFSDPYLEEAVEESKRFLRKAKMFMDSDEYGTNAPSPLRASTKRASMDATRALAAWRKENK